MIELICRVGAGAGQALGGLQGGKSVSAAQGCLKPKLGLPARDRSDRMSQSAPSPQALEVTVLVPVPVIAAACGSRALPPRAPIHPLPGTLSAHPRSISRDACYYEMLLATREPPPGLSASSSLAETLQIITPVHDRDPSSLRAVGNSL